MTAKVIDGKAFAAGVRAQVAAEVAKLKANNGIVPGLAVVLVGEDPASKVYVKNKHASTIEVGMNSFEHRLDADTSEAHLLALIAQLNADPALEPLQAGPVVIEDGAFIGARAEVAEGVQVGEGAVLSMGVYLGASTKVIDRATGEVHIGKVPPYAVVVSGTMPGKPLPDGSPGPGLYCGVIVKTVDAQTRSKTGINELLRD